MRPRYTPDIRWRQGYDDCYRGLVGLSDIAKRSGTPLSRVKQRWRKWAAAHRVAPRRVGGVIVLTDRMASDFMESLKGKSHPRKKLPDVLPQGNPSQIRIALADQGVHVTKAAIYQRLRRDRINQHRGSHPPK